MSIAGILGFIFFYIAVGLIFFALGMTDSQVDIMEQEAREYWHIEYNCKGGEPYKM